MPTTLNWAGPSTLAAARPGDTVIVPAGIHDTPPFNISTSHLTLQIDGVLRSSAARRDWPLLPPLPTYGRDRDGAKARRHQALILLHNAHHVTIRGTRDPSTVADRGGGIIARAFSRAAAFDRGAFVFAHRD